MSHIDNQVGCGVGVISARILEEAEPVETIKSEFLPKPSARESWESSWIPPSQFPAACLNFKQKHKRNQPGKHAHMLLSMAIASRTLTSCG